MKRKTNKKSGIIAAVVGLSAVSLVSVGFASWVMSGGDTETLEGQISVETVDDQRFVICRTEGYAPTVHYGNAQGKDKGNQTASKIVFGIDDSTPIANAWLTAGGTGDKAPKYENLEATVSFYVANLTTEQTTVPSATLAVVDNASNGWATASGNTKNYVKAPASLNLACAISATETYVEDSLTYRKVTATIEFDWGTAFGGDNPYVFYNAQPYSLALSNTAKDVLEELEDLLTGVSFTVTLATTVPNA